MPVSEQVSIVNLGTKEVEIVSTSSTCELYQYEAWEQKGKE
jgi:hypothetical protein